jgi:sugar phosphate isomerase/epimerase
MKQRRREFLKLGTNIAAGIVLLPVISKCTSSENKTAEAGGVGIDTFGLQLYSLRDDLPKDPKGVLQKVSSFGYKQIESYEHDKLGMFWGMTNTDFKKYMDDLGMVIVASHCNINKDFEKKVNDAAAIGMKYLICPSVDTQKTVDDYKKIAAQFNQCAEICKKAGIRFAYHNHDHDFKKIEGQIPQDIYMQNTDASLVDFEMDIFWVVTSGNDPEEWLNKYPNRFRFCHIKDRIKGTTEREASCDLGKGSIDFKKVLKTAKDKGMQYYIVEQERYDGSNPLKAIEVDAVYMKSFKM